MTLRERIEARRAGLLSERATAEAAKGGWWHALDAVVDSPSAGGTYDHLDAQDPDATRARIQAKVEEMSA